MFAICLTGRSKLSPSKYKEFVNSMRALKSKAMKITEVLGSIARLFSGTDRFPLLKRYHVYSTDNYMRSRAS